MPQPVTRPAAGFRSIRPGRKIQTLLPYGVNASGMEYPTGLPGSLGTNYFQPTAALMANAVALGFDTIRLPYLWERMQPVVNGPLSALYKSEIDTCIQRAASAGVKVVLDMHNYGRRFIWYDGGFTSNFAAADSKWSSGTVTGGKLQVTSFTPSVAGSLSNARYKFTVKAEINSVDGPDVWRNLWLYCGYRDPFNHFHFNISSQNDYVQLYKTVNGVETQIGSNVATTIDLNTQYTVVMDHGYTTPGTLTVTIDGVQKFSTTIPDALLSGKVGVNPSGVTGKIDDVEVRLYDGGSGDITAGNTSDYYRVGSTELPISAFADHWDKMSEAYRDNPNVIAYDLNNEWYDMPGGDPTPSTFLTCTSVLANQAAIDSIRGNNDDTWIAIQYDSFSNMHKFTEFFGSNPDVWWDDPLNRTIISPHYYFNTEHSGEYAEEFNPNSFTRLETEVLPILQWAYSKGVYVMIGETAWPKDDKRWSDVAEKFLLLCAQYNAWVFYWSVSDSVTTGTALDITSSTVASKQYERVLSKFQGTPLPTDDLPPISPPGTPDTAAPVITITSPATNPVTVPVTPTVISGYATDNVGVVLVTYQLNGGTETPCFGTASWATPALTLDAGANTVIIKAYDAAGNTDTETLTITYTEDTPPAADTTAPALTVASPSTPSTVTSETLAITGTSSDAVGVIGVTYALNGAAEVACTGTTSWSASLTLVEGVNTIVIRARDAAQNTTSTTLTITYTPPTPPDNSTNAEYLAIDDMANQKDLLDNGTIISAGNPARVTALCTAMAAQFPTTTHIQLSVPMNTNAEAISARGSAFKMEPALYAKRWADAIHAAGKNVMWRGADCRMEGIYNFPRWVGGNRYPQGQAYQVLGTPFSDDFARTLVGTTDYQTGHQPSNMWTISSGALQGPASDGWRRTLLTKKTYKNVVFQAKVKKVGNQQIIVRATTDANFPGYGLQLRDGEVRLERSGLENLASASKTTTPNSFYQMKLEANGSTIRGKVWLDGDDEPDAWDVSVTNTAYANAGFCGVSGETSNGLFDDFSITHTPDRANWLGRAYNYIVDNAAMFADGDRIGFYPEQTGHGIFQDSTSFISYSSPGVQQNFANFFIDLKTVCEGAAAAIGKNLICGQTTQNWSEVNSGWIPASLWNAYGIIIVDHYGTDGEGHTAAQMKADIRHISQINNNKKVYIQEWGDYWSTDSSHTSPIRNQAQHEAYLDTMYAAFQELIDEGTLLGFGYWRYTGGAERLATEPTTNNFTLNYAGLKAKAFFDANDPNA